MSDQSETWKCACGHQNSLVAMFCVNCGKPKPIVSPPPIPNLQQPQPTPPNIPPELSVLSQLKKPPKLLFNQINVTEHWGYPVESVNSTQPSPDELNHAIFSLTSGNDLDSTNALHLLASQRSLPVLYSLIQYVQDTRYSNITRKKNAIQVLACVQRNIVQDGTNDFSGINFLLNQVKKISYRPYVCQALAFINHPSVIPFLLKVTKDGWSGVNLDADQDELNTLSFVSFLCRYFSLAGLGMSRSISILPSLVMDVLQDRFTADYSDFSIPTYLSIFTTPFEIRNFFQSSDNAILLVGSSVDPNLDFDEIVNLPGMLKRVWMYRNRIAVIRKIVENCDPDILTRQLPSTKDNLQRLMVALPLLDHTQYPWQRILAEGTDAIFAEERIISFDGFVQLSLFDDQESSIQYVKKGLIDQTLIVRLAVASSIILNQVERLLPETYNFLLNPSEMVRKAMIRSVLKSASQGSQWSLEVLKDMAKKDPSPDIREFIIDNRPSINSI